MEPAIVKLELTSNAIEEAVVESMRIDRENRLLAREEQRINDARNQRQEDRAQKWHNASMEWHDYSMHSFRTDLDKQRLHWLRCFANSVMYADMKLDPKEIETKIDFCFDVAEAMLAESERRWSKMQAKDNPDAP